ncbi:dihydroorotate dehydrogenase [Candidatus Woesearchaeota archaeon]|nr:dihydroorotate dehydrogenase [Candidatus Woesearchaeota archaeon]
MADISTEICGVKLKNPMVLASGIMGVTGSSLANVVSHGVGAVTIKSLGLKPRKGHSCPVISTFKSGMINAVGLSNPGINTGIKEIKKFKDLCDAPIIGSIFAFKRDGYGELAKKISKAEPDLIEINVSCPNVEDEAGTPFALDKKAVYKTTKITKKNTDIPVIVKLSPNSLNIKEIAQACEKAGADAINMGNTLGPGLVINIETARPILSNKFGGVSGPAIKPITMKRIWDIYDEVNIPIIGTGGASCGKDAIEMIMAGSSAVGIGSAVYYRGLDVFEKINKEIKEFMEKNNYSSIKEMIGIAHESKL